jgi:aminoglycoside phosphotransferase (APT) family kinase protein
MGDMLASTSPADLIPVDRLARWMDGRALGRGPIEDLGTIGGGGTQNIVLSFVRAGRRYVLRRPPPTPRPESNETMRREARVLGALAGSDVPHPALIAACGHEDVLGTTFYLMEPVEGFTATVGLPPLHAGSAAIRRAMGFALVDGAASLGRVDYIAAGLEGFGKPDKYLARQVARWQSQLDSYARFDGWPGVDELPGLSRVAAYLDRNCPTSFEPGIIHGDYSLGNVMFRNDGPELAAIVDWELTTIGDPLIDLGWILATWRGEDGVDLDVLVVDPWDGFPTGEELIAHYGRQTDRDLAAIDWYIVLACYKLGIILEGTFARACAGRDPRDVGDKLHDTAQKLIRRALNRIG